MSEDRTSHPQIDLREALPLLPLRSAALFPGVVIPLDVGRPKTIALAEAISKSRNGTVLVFSQKDPKVEDPGPDDLHPVGVLAKVVGALRQEAGRHALVLQGLSRVRLDEVVTREPYLTARAQPLVDGEVLEASEPELAALGLSLKETTRELIDRLPQLPREIVAQLAQFDQPGPLADFIAGHMEASVEDKVALLAQTDVNVRVREVLRLVSRRLETERMRERIQSQVKDEMGRTQREHILRKQLDAIREELGQNDDDEDNVVDELEARVKGATLSAEATEVARKQIKRLRGMQPSSPDFTSTRTYVEWILDLPWTAPAPESGAAVSATTPVTRQSADAADLLAVRAVLEADHFGLEPVKKRILEFLAVRKLKADKRGPILCLVGPPGVGKTSLAKSIARAVGRKLHRVSLGGVHDEAAIRGHRRTYVGSLPGQIIQGMKKVGTTNPVFVLDEVDKLGRDYQGDPASALLEVLDPEQNGTFSDHYLEIPYDLSNVMFIATANTMDTIAPPLRDRMEVIEIPGYTQREKLAIAKRHLVPKQLSEHGLTPEQLVLDDATIEQVIEGYTREAGVRSLERKLAAIARGVVVAIAEGVGERSIHVGPDDLSRYLGAAHFEDDAAERTEDPGVATGLAWTSVGGVTLFVEATQMPGHGKLILTGQLGDVMKESAQAALSYVRAHADRYGIAKDVFEARDVHIHVPAGAMPKDGPSAGVTMLTSLVSLLTGTKVRPDVAMTGEITLRGRVLPIGGVKEKALAAHRAGLRRIILPERNRAQAEEIPAEVRQDLEIVFVSRMDDVLEAALVRSVLVEPAAPENGGPLVIGGGVLAAA